MRLERLDRIVALISRKSTGCPAELASRLGISKRTLYNDLEILKGYGAIIEFSIDRNSFLFKEKVLLSFNPKVDLTLKETITEI